MSGNVFVDDQTAPLVMPKETATQLADSGITTFINVGREILLGTGLSPTGVDDERVLQTSVFSAWQSLRNAIPEPLDSLRAIFPDQGIIISNQGALLGIPVFRSDDNTVETIPERQILFHEHSPRSPRPRVTSISKSCLRQEGYSVLLAA